MVTRGENVRKKVSELMDGELENTDAVAIINAVKSDSNLLSDWEIYHAIKDSLHQSVVSIDVSEKIRNKLIDEPLLLMPHPHKKYHKQKLLGFSIAASITALSVGWLIFQSVEQHETTLKEVYVAEKVNDKTTPIGEQRSLVTFQPVPSYSFSSVPGNNNYPLIYRGVTHESVGRYPSVGMSPAIEPARAQSVMSVE